MSIPPSLEDAPLTQSAGPAAFKRGSEYQRREMIRSLILTGPRATAEVAGSQPGRNYKVNLHIVGQDDDSRLRFHCNCPVGIRKQFCKHCVAVALVWRAALQELDPSSAQSLQIAQTINAEEAPLRPDSRVPEHALLPEHTTVDRSSLLKTMSAAFRVTGGFVEYRQMPAFTRRIHDALDHLEDYLSLETAQDAVKLCEQNLMRVERTFDRVDDSRGDMRPIAARLTELHFKAARAAIDAGQLESVKLAERIFVFEMTSDWEILLDAYELYRDAFGEVGRARYRELAADAFDRGTTAGGEPVSNFAIRRLIRTIALDSRDPEKIVAAYEANLDNEYELLRMVRDLESIGRPDLALHWARQGLARDLKHGTNRLSEHLAQRTAEEGDLHRAAALAGDAFAKQPGMAGFISLHAFASLAGCWPALREEAMGQLRAQICGSDPLARSAREIIVSAQIWECEIDSALAAIAEFGAYPHQLLALANDCERGRPEVAIEIYLARAGETLAGPANNDRRYRDATALLTRCAEIAETARMTDVFQNALAEMRERHERKRKFLKMIEGL